jgi:hypothetical protein
MLDAGEALPHALFSSAADLTSYDDSDWSADRYSVPMTIVVRDHQQVVSHGAQP